MRTITGVAIGTIAFWLAMLATAVAYILEHIFAIGVATALVIAAVLPAVWPIPARRRRAVRPPRHPRKDAVTVGRLAGAHSAPTAHMRKVV
ncbi:hypothetical protein BN970_06854 [Mycolicibacterium conceptionense]|uniref:Transmembrane protein n=1 Tax=Mycolicibacterium conceptionense TaxID=451644 RepID=A0A0U1E0S8_9MYCO|nr:hypothetical protein BN970_06854 [Mycolicibacterium conceptionense]